MDKPITELVALSNGKDVFQTTIPNSVHWSLYKSGKLRTRTIKKTPTSISEQMRKYSTIKKVLPHLVVGETTTAVSLKRIADKTLSQNESINKLIINNEGKLPALMDKVDVTGVKWAFVASDNYVGLQPGEAKKITMNVLWREAKKNIVIQVQAWNEPKIQIKLFN